MRIALVTYSLQLGGVETLLHNLATELRERGQQVSFVETEHRGDWSDLTRSLGFELIFCGRRVAETRAQHCLRLTRALGGFDALLVNNAPLAMAALGALPPNVVAIPVLHMALPDMIMTATAAAGQWQRIVTVAPGAVERLTMSGLIQAGQALWIPNGVRLQPISRGRPIGLPLRVAYAGRLEDHQKNVFAMARILEMAIARGVTLKFDVIGDGPDAKALDADLRRRRVPYVMHGRLSQAETMLRVHDADILLMPSRYEGLPMTLLEAMACGVVPVVSKLPGSTDAAVESGVNGFLIDSEDESAFAGAIAALARDPARLSEFSARARDTISRQFSIAAMGAAYLRLIETCREEIRDCPPARTGRISMSLLGEFPNTPYALVRPLRKAMRTLGLYPASRGST